MGSAIATSSWNGGSTGPVSAGSTGGSKGTRAQHGAGHGCGARHAGVAGARAGTGTGAACSYGCGLLAAGPPPDHSRRRHMNAHAAGQHPRPWATLYQIYVRSWRDSNRDGYGDLRGVIPGSTTWRGWGWTASGCRRPCLPPIPLGLRRLGLPGRSPTCRAPWMTLTSWWRRRASGACACCWTWCPTTPAAPTPGSWTPGRAGERRTAAITSGPAAAGGGPPNNWRSVTGAPAWTFDDASGQYYLHNFLPSQPDLNWRSRPSTRSSTRSCGSGSTGGSPASASTSRRASTRTKPCATTRRTPGRAAWPAGPA